MLKQACMTVGATLTALVLITSGSAVSASAAGLADSTGSSAVITAPEGLNVAGLSIHGGPQSTSSVFVSGCTVGGVARLSFVFRYPQAGEPSDFSVTSDIPIAFAPAIGVPESGVVDFALLPITEWLVVHQPFARAEIVITAACIDDVDGGPVVGPAVILVIPAGAGFDAPPPTTPVPDSDPALPSDPASPPVPVGEPVVVADGPFTGDAARTAVLAETGFNDSGLAIPFAIALVLMLSGVALRLRGGTRSDYWSEQR